jgi:hypothetical protein
MIEYALTGVATVDDSAYDPFTTEQHRFVEGHGSDERRSTSDRHCIVGRPRIVGQHRLINQYRTAITRGVSA